MIARRRQGLVICAVLLMLGIAGWTGWRWATVRARTVTDAAAATLAHNQAGLLASELQKFRLLPLVLAEHPDLARAMTAGRGRAAARDRMNRTLELLAGRTDAAVLYAIDTSGRTVAASNWRLPTSFVGQEYGFRPYFTQAMRSGAAELFALGTVSGRPGLYLARRVDRVGRAAGVIVVKVEFDALEASWRRAGGITFATDAHGVVLVTSVPGWRFAATGVLDRATLTETRRTLQFGAAYPRRVPFARTGASARIGDAPYRAADLPVPFAGGRVVAMVAQQPAFSAARTQALLWGLGLMVMVGLVGGGAWRTAEKRRIGRENHARLEAEVARRTAELRDANAALTAESRSRAEAEQRFRAAREELAQANRLGSLGQIVAGVAHEINQPVAAIRTYADNGVVLLDRDRADAARDNLGRIAGLADRIGAITAELRSFARRRTPASGSVRLGEVLDGVGLLMGEAIARHVTVAVAEAERGCAVTGDRVRLEQVIVNLLRNALEAVADGPGAAITVTAATAADRLALRISDEGPGVHPELRDQLFAPFATGRPDGLGLGLAIARTIAREFGGDLVLADDAGDGATFILTLRRA